MNTATEIAPGIAAEPDDAIQYRAPRNVHDDKRRAAYEFPDLAPPAGTVRIVRNRYRAWLKRRGLSDPRWNQFAFGAATEDR